MSARKRGLGRGLDALLGNQKAAVRDEAGGAATVGEDKLRQMPVDLIQRGKYQPRRDIESGALEELAASIRVQGVMQPVVVRPIGSGRYELIAGERRWRATQLAGLDSIPAIVRDVPDEAAIAMALIENIQRENLNPLEEAVALDRLRREFELTQQEVADAVGKSRAAVANLLRLLGLQDDVKLMLERGDLELGHAKALLALPVEAQSGAARTVVGKALTVRQTEALVKKLLAGGTSGRRTSPPDPDILRLQEELAEKIGAPVAIHHGTGGKGKLVLSYNSLDELDGILQHIR